MITSALALPGGEGWIGLALVRRAALEQEQLWCVAEPADPSQAPAAGGVAGLPLGLSRPELFTAPPVGAAGR
jgi:hypothetical protein